MYHLIPKTNFLDYLKKVLPVDTFEAFLRGSIFNKTAFCSGEKQGMLVNDECSSWYNKVGDFLVSVWDRRKEILYGNESVCMARQDPTPECMVSGTEFHDGECEGFIHSFILNFFHYL